jgi:hypothetical protein
MIFYIGFGAAILGVVFVAVGHYTLFFELKKSTTGDTHLTLTAIKSAYTLVIGGLIMIIIGLLYLMSIIPWYNV